MPVKIVDLLNEEDTVKDGERICRMIIAKHERVKWDEVEILDERNREKGGFEPTGHQ